MPFVVTKEYTTGIDNQTAMSFKVVQGEREMVADCRALASFELQSIPPAKAGMVKVEVAFSIDANGILSVTAREPKSGITHNIEVHSSFNLDEDLINQQLTLAFSNASIDHENKLLAETKLEAEEIIVGIKKAMQETPDVLTENELKEITGAINSLQKVINLDNRDSILKQAGYLNKLAVNFIQKHLDKGAQGLLEGKNIYDI
jgi:molecular chaperone HscA